ncbi:MAG: hypothetical protein IIT46_10350 [Lachnospiraceae bacterium]|nr:hypothetical protein [Lachnospiraceae bacterium]MCR4802307.1 hypothetical protein [Lachnospiraceae bacterium]
MSKRTRYILNVVGGAIITGIKVKNLLDGRNGVGVYISLIFFAMATIVYLIKLIGLLSAKENEE